MLTPFPSATAVALALGARLTLRGLTLRRNPWTFGVRVSHPHYRYSCQHSHFRCLQQRSRATFTGLRNAPLPRSEDRCQKSDFRAAAMQRGEHAGDLVVFAPPSLRCRRIEVAEIAAIQHSHLHLIGRADRHDQKAAEFRFRKSLPAKTLRQVGTDRFRRPPHLIGQPELFDPRKVEACPVYLQRYPIGPPEYIEILTPINPTAHCVSAILIADFCLLDTRSFGARLEPRYIFGAGRLIDQ